MSDKINTLREFGKFRLDAEKRVLWFEEKPVVLPLKETELLCVLTENAGAVVTKDEILQKVWRDAFVEESNLTRHMYVLRKTLKDLGAGSDLIQTVPRRGYRFAGEVREIENVSGKIVIEKHTRTRTLIEFQEENKAGRKRAFLSQFLSPATVGAVLIALIVAAAFFGYQSWRAETSAAPLKSIAVLPFKKIDSNKENEHQGLGLADVLITRLSNIKELNVRPTSAVLSFENEAQDSVSFGKKLLVDSVLEGTIYGSNNKVRVTARLIRVADGSTVWTGQFEKLAADELKLQDEIALQVVNALALNLNPDAKSALAKHYTENADAYQLYVKGRYEWNKRSLQGMASARKLFHDAIEKDPNFALAYVGLADTTAMTASWEETGNAVQKALELDPNLAEAHASRGFIQMFQNWKWAEAEESLKKSIELNPNYATAHQWYATLLAIQGRHAEAKTEMRRALEINPLSHNFLADLGQIYYFNREYREAEEYCRRALEIYPDFVFAHEYLANIYLKTGEYEKAVEEEIAAHKIYLALANESVERRKFLEAQFESREKGFREGGIRRFAEELLSPDPAISYLNAGRYAFLGDKEKALAALEKAFEGRGFLIAFVKADPVFDDLRDEPRYQEILRKMNLL